LCHSVKAALAANSRAGINTEGAGGAMLARVARTMRREYRQRMSTNDRARWLLLGAGGLVGGHLRAALAGRDVVATSHRTAVPGTVSLDLTDEGAVTRVLDDVRPDVIVVAAADAFVEGCERDPVATRAINVTAVERLSDLAPGTTLVVFSSEYVFDGRAGPYGEDDPTAPINEYGRQKVELEKLARRTDHLICRVSGVYGWSAARTSFVAQLVDRLRGGRHFAVPADQVITPTPAPDLARAVVALVERGARGTFHCAGPEVLARPEFARRAALAFDLDPSLIDAVPTASLGLRAARPTSAGLKTEKLRSVLGRSLPVSADALADMRRTEAAESRRAEPSA
jgi:dTDP-4-dehydrorhamnose reductase